MRFKIGDLIRSSDWRAHYHDVVFEVISFEEFQKVKRQQHKPIQYYLIEGKELYYFLKCVVSKNDGFVWSRRNMKSYKRFVPGNVYAIPISKIDMYYRFETVTKGRLFAEAL